MAKRIITEKDIVASAARGDKILSVPLDQCIVTAQALDKALELGLSLDNINISAPSQEETANEGSIVASVDLTLLASIVSKVVERMHRILPPDSDPSDVAQLVRDAVAARLAPGTAQRRNVDEDNGSGVIFVDNTSLLENSNAPDIKGKALLAEAVGRPGESRLAAGYLLWEDMSFERCAQSPEIIVIIEGKLHLMFDGRTVVAKPGDMAYLPAGTCVNFAAPARVKLICINTSA